MTKKMLVFATFAGLAMMTGCAGAGSEKSSSNDESAANEAERTQLPEVAAGVLRPADSTTGQGDAGAPPPGRDAHDNPMF
jgi:hypothetical protein